MSDIPEPAPRQIWVPRKAGSRAKARRIATVNRYMVWYADPSGEGHLIDRKTWDRWVRKSDARPAVQP